MMNSSEMCERYVWKPIRQDKQLSLFEIAILTFRHLLGEKRITLMLVFIRYHAGRTLTSLNKCLIKIDWRLHEQISQAKVDYS